MTSSASFPDDARWVEDLSRLLAEMAGVGDFLDGLADLVTRVLPNVDAAGITTRLNDHPVTIVGSDDLVAAVDERQYAAGQGPCLQALHTGEPVTMRDITEEVRWPDFTASARATGVHSIHSVPLRTGDTVLAAFNLYSLRPDAFSASACAQAAAFGRQASQALETALAHNLDAGHRIRDTLEYRAVIDRALGFLMERHSCTAQQALDILRAAAHRRGGELRVIAADILAGTEPFGDH